jgi:KaiC/GvpD/RAD55 family RecA-like ATPase
LLDDWLGGMQDGAMHLFTGGTGSGKSTVALHFADAGLRRQETVVMLVRERVRGATLRHANFLGIDLGAPLRDARLLLFRYHSEFTKRLAQTASPIQAIAELERIALTRRPARVIIDTIAPFVCGAAPVGQMAIALAELLERSEASVLLTFPEDLGNEYDRNLEPLVQSAAAVIRLAREDGNVRRAELMNLRYSASPAGAVRFVIRPGAGIVTEHAVGVERPMLRMS